MTRAKIAGAAFAVLIVLLAVAAGYRVVQGGVDRSTPPPSTPRPADPTPTVASASADPAGEEQRGFLYGRVTTTDGATYEGRLRWGGTEEAFWDDYFNGYKAENEWVGRLSPEQRPKERDSLGFFGVTLISREREREIERPFMVRFGDVSRIEADGGHLWVTLKGGKVFHLDRFNADDFADGLRVWDAQRGEVDLEEGRMRSVELMPTPRLADTPTRLHGTVRTRHGEELTGTVQWNRSHSVGSDELTGQTAEGEEVHLPFDRLAAIAHESDSSALVTLKDGSQRVLSDSRDVGRGHRGVQVDDPRYGRVLVPWDAFQRLDLTGGDSGPGYDAFPPARPLTGSVTTRDGRHLAGRLVFDVDEGLSVETLDAESRGLDYTIPFGRIASIVPPGGEADDSGLVQVTLHGGEEVSLGVNGDLGAQNPGMVVFVGGDEDAEPEFVPWAEVERVDFEPATASEEPAS